METIIQITLKNRIYAISARFNNFKIGTHESVLCVTISIKFSPRNYSMTVASFPKSETPPLVLIYFRKPPFLSEGRRQSDDGYRGDWVTLRLSFGTPHFPLSRFSTKTLERDMRWITITRENKKCFVASHDTFSFKMK